MNKGVDSRVRSARAAGEVLIEHPEYGLCEVQDDPDGLLQRCRLLHVASGAYLDGLYDVWNSRPAVNEVVADTVPLQAGGARSARRQRTG